MTAISNLSWEKNVLSWTFLGDGRIHEFSAPIDSAISLRKTNGIAVIENGAIPKAIILNPDGSIRAELKNPFRPEEGFQFYYFNYEREKLVVILASRTGDFVSEIDEVTGVLSVPKETR